uniref:FYVE zinc finger domain-containing protein n=1 Tax=Monodelphis domestica TaxID=13616 RepID=A0A5F8H8I7_MONDO
MHHTTKPSGIRQAAVAGSPEQPTRSHLDDDGMPVYTDAIQQRLRQIETGHQQEVETLKKQVQELRSRLESQCLNSSLRFNGDFGDEVMTRWLPDHLAAHCYGCDSAFWLASRKHHCSWYSGVWEGCCARKIPNLFPNLSIPVPLILGDLFGVQHGWTYSATFSV